MASLFSSVTSYLQPMSRTTVLVSIAAVATVTLFAVTKLLYKRRETRKNAATVTSLKIYPIKSVPGLTVDHLEITETCAKYGNFYDRSMVLLNTENRVITLRQSGSLATIKTSISGPSQLTLKANSMEDLVIDVNSDSPVKGQIIRFSWLSTATSGFEVSQEASNWFSKFLNEPNVRLVKFTSECKHRPSDVATAKGDTRDARYKIRYQDASPIHLCNLATLNTLNECAKSSGKAFVIDAFRPNITVQSGVPGEELSWFSCTIDSITFLSIRACTRCAIPTMEVSTGERDPDKMKIMFNHRSAQDEYEKKNYSKNPMFGINLLPKTSGRINLGSSVDVSFF